MTVISIGHPLIYTLSANKVTKIDLSSYTLEIPKDCRLGFKVTHDIHFNVDNEHVEPHLGFWITDEGHMTFETKWYKEHVLYMVSEVETTVTFEVILDYQVRGKQS